MSTHDRVPCLPSRSVRTYLTDLATYRDEVFGQDASGLPARGVVEIAVEWIDGRLVDSDEPLDPRTAAEPWRVRSALVRAIGGDAPGTTHLVRAVELLALGASMHDGIGEERPWVAATDRELVLLGDLLFGRALAEINRGPAELQWIVENTFRELVLNQFIASTPRGRDSATALHAATVGGNGRLASAAVRCSALLVGRGERDADRLGAIGSALALGTQLAFDLGHPGRHVGHAVEINHRSAPLLAQWDIDPSASPSPEQLERAARQAVAVRGLDAVWRARNQDHRLPPDDLARFAAVGEHIERALLGHADLTSGFESAPARAR